MLRAFLAVAPLRRSTRAGVPAARPPDSVTHKPHEHTRAGLAHVYSLWQVSPSCIEWPSSTVEHSEYLSSHHVRASTEHLRDTAVTDTG